MQKFKLFIVDSFDEMKNKVSWPKYSELQNSSILVLVASMIFALMIGGFDWVFKTTMQWFYQSF